MVSVCDNFCIQFTTALHAEFPVELARPLQLLWTKLALRCPLVAIAIMVPASVGSSIWVPLLSTDV